MNSKTNPSASDSFAILSASLWDLGALYFLEHTCFQQDAWPLPDLVAVLVVPGVIRLKAVRGWKMIGFIAADPHPPEDFAWIATLAVHPQFRRQGVGRRLLLACEARLNVARVRLTVRQSNHPAMRLYESAGYRIVDSIPGYYRDGEAAWVMEKEMGDGPWTVDGGRG